MEVVRELRDGESAGNGISSEILPEPLQSWEALLHLRLGFELRFEVQHKCQRSLVDPVLNFKDLARLLATSWCLGCVEFLLLGLCFLFGSGTSLAWVLTRVTPLQIIPRQRHDGFFCEIPPGAKEYALVDYEILCILTCFVVMDVSELCVLARIPEGVIMKFIFRRRRRGCAWLPRPGACVLIVL